jgi:hypothetical protein
MSQPELAKVIGCNQSTVSRMLSLFRDSRQEARAHLDGQSLKMAESVVDKGSPDLHRQVLTQLDVLPDKGSHGGGNFMLVVGQPGRVPPELEPPTIDVTPVPGGDAA